MWSLLLVVKNDSVFLSNGFWAFLVSMLEQSNCTKSRVTKKTQLGKTTKYLLKKVSIELIGDSNRGNDRDENERQGQKEGDDVAPGAGTCTRDHTQAPGSAFQRVAGKTNRRRDGQARGLE
ncbi:hypothetical protein PanWU01x14_051980 [Parasponia andersonii]|uniref:Uncharacterized protein n=1 Tax=Parasponia andersonii TaxID=3476 RepID=A0A2P5DM60_PARAD|nr:hypothetical protein PanWU01x14_051980 [Parasponia andersonii]